MAKTPIDPAQALRDRRAQQARDDAEHELPLLEEIGAVAAEMKPLLDRLVAVRGQLLDEGLPLHIDALLTINGHMVEAGQRLTNQARLKLEA